MSATLIVSLLLGAAGLATSVFGVITQVRDRGRSVRRQEGDIKKLEGAIELDETTRTRLAAEAAQINSDVAIAQQNWWRDQFDAVRTELVVEQEWRRDMAKRLKAHQPWDDRMYRQAQEHGWNVDPPPRLDPNGDAS